MYESPINAIVTEIEQNIREEQEKCILEAVRHVGIEVDKDELVKALAYDRRQYENGYRDALRTIREKLEEVIKSVGEELMMLEWNCQP